MLLQPQQVLGHVNLAAAVMIDSVEALPQRLVAHLALLRTHEDAKLAKVELAVVVPIRLAPLLSAFLDACSNLSYQLFFIIPGTPR